MKERRHLFARKIPTLSLTFCIVIFPSSLTIVYIPMVDLVDTLTTMTILWTIEILSHDTYCKHKSIGPQFDILLFYLVIGDGISKAKWDLMMQLYLPWSMLFASSKIMIFEKMTWRMYFHTLQVVKAFVWRIWHCWWCF
jgi:hypothetical protein